MRGRCGIGAVLLRAGDPVAVAVQGVAVDLDVERGRNGDAATPQPRAPVATGRVVVVQTVATHRVAADDGVLRDLVEDPLVPVVLDQIAFDQGVGRVDVPPQTLAVVVVGEGVAHGRVHRDELHAARLEAARLPKAVARDLGAVDEGARDLAVADAEAGMVVHLAADDLDVVAADVDATPAVVVDVDVAQRPVVTCGLDRAVLAPGVVVADLEVLDGHVRGSTAERTIDAAAAV